ncbi:uncharacterized protein LOC114938878 [Nylanderia fulva]|uniref:uncharacterized protein LOC114938878 n=1 Tax=Nylanderia fulva TaxID=613905 RepID=UPI0010FAF3BE|nr:uncharacterized protein LOC114938878 [Nylanderia fulva]
MPSANSLNLTMRMIYLEGKRTVCVLHFQLFYFVQKMNHMAFGLILICCLTRAIETNGYHVFAKRTMFEEFLEKFKIILKTGNESLGIPVLDPFTAKQMPIKLYEQIINLNALLTNVNVDGLSEYKVIEGDFQVIGMKLNINLSWPLITASTDYTMKGNADSYEFYGNGEIDLSARDFVLETEIGFTVNGEHFKVRNMKLKLSLRALDFRVTGLFDDEELSNVLSAVISDTAPEFFKDATIMERLRHLTTEKIDAFLSTKMIGELLEFLGVLD